MRMVVFSVLLLIIILFFRNGLFGHNEVTWTSIGRRLKPPRAATDREVSGAMNKRVLGSHPRHHALWRPGRRQRPEPCTSTVRRSSRSSARTARARPTAFNMITGVYTPTEGSVTLLGRNITGMRPDRIAARRHRANLPEYPPL